MLVPLFLFEKELLSSPMFYLSGYFETHREVYYARLQAISQDGDWNGWIQFFLTAVLEQARTNTDKARSIFNLYERMKREIPEITRSQYATQAIDALFDRPIFRSTDFIERSTIPKATAKRILTVLREKEIIQISGESSGSRATVFNFPELMVITEG